MLLAGSTPLAGLMPLAWLVPLIGPAAARSALPGAPVGRRASAECKPHQHHQNHQNRSPGQPMLIMTIDLLLDACRTQ
jgi:hypothetical protein